MVAFFVMLAMVISLTGCGFNTSGSSSASATGDYNTGGEGSFNPRSVCEGVTLTIAVPSKDDVEDYETNHMTVAIEEALGVNLSFQVIPSSSYVDRLNLMVASGADLPDIIYCGNGISIHDAHYDWANQGAIISLNQYYEDPNFSANITMMKKQLGVDFGWHLSDANGNIYAAPRYDCYMTDEASQKIWINTKIAEQLGFEELPTTTEEFLELVRAFHAAGDINGNGIDDEYALVGYDTEMNWFRFMMSAYVYAFDDYFLNVQNDKLSFSYTCDAWKEGLKYVKTFFDEDLLDFSILIQDNATYQRIAKDASNVQLAVVGHHPLQIGTDDYETIELRLGFDYVPAFSSPIKKAEAYYAPSLTKAGGVITSDCENPDAAFLVLDYMCSPDMSINNRYGEQGITWDYGENVDAAKLFEGTTPDSYIGRIADEYPVPFFYCYPVDDFAWNAGVVQNYCYMQAGPAIGLPDAWTGAAIRCDSTAPESRNYINWERKYVQSVLDTLAMRPDEIVLFLPMRGDERAEVSEIQYSLDNYVKESIGAFLSGEWDIDEAWESYLSVLEKIGIDRALEIYQNSYNRTLQ